MSEVKFSKKEMDLYKSRDDKELRAFCVSVLARKDGRKYTTEVEDLCYMAEILRNYIRFGRPYAPHWVE